VSEEIELPWRKTGLDGFSTTEGPTYKAGWFTGGGPIRNRNMAIRLLAPMGRPAPVEVDLTEPEHHGCSVSLDPDTAEHAGRALIAGPERARAEMERWRGVVERLAAEMSTSAYEEAMRRAGMTREGE
jgi:hypothetical protein